MKIDNLYRSFYILCISKTFFTRASQQKIQFNIIPVDHVYRLSATSFEIERHNMIGLVLGLKYKMMSLSIQSCEIS